MLLTPNTDHIASNTYPPAEDSFLFLDALSADSEIAYLNRRFPKPTVSPLTVEIGTGSGIILAFLAANAQAILGRTDLLSLGTDVNPEACQAAAQTVESHCNASKLPNKMAMQATLGCINGDLAGPLKPGEIDILLFNPPYVPSDAVPTIMNVHKTGTFERDNTLLAFATDGGADGMEVIERLLQSLPAVLSSRGVAYVLLCRRNKPDEVAQRIRSWETGVDWTVDVVKDSGRTGGIERLCILRIARNIF